MNGRHLTEDMLQQYALEPGKSPDEAVTHLFECAQCRAVVSAYEHLGAALREQQAPAFEFDLAAAVIAQLESPSMAVVAASKPQQVSRLLIFVIALLVAIPAWIFRKTAYFVFSDMSGELAWTVLSFAGIAVLFSFYKYYRKYQQVLHLINN